MECDNKFCYMNLNFIFYFCHSSGLFHDCCSLCFSFHCNSHLQRLAFAGGRLAGGDGGFGSGGAFRDGAALAG
jgi:hypothetical protein